MFYLRKLINRMARLLYTLVFYCLTPIILLKLWLRGKKAPEYRLRWAERFGLVKWWQGERPIWIHAVSLGETIAVIPLVERLLQEHPDIPVIITSMTPTGSARVLAQFGARVQHCYCPYDLPDALSRFHQRIQPRSCVIVETELWPNLIHSCKRRDIPVSVINARLSSRSARGYGKVSWLSRPMLQNISRIAVQNSDDGERFIELGLGAEKLEVTGSIKFDISVPADNDERISELREAWGCERPVLIGASTHDNEDQQLLEIYTNLQSRYNNLLLILVPRHPERFAEVYDQSVKAGWHTCRRSLGQLPTHDCQVYIGDTMGDLMLLYGAADIVFVGGSLIERGGHNPLEPAVLSKPVLMGANYFNFNQIVSHMEQELALQTVADKRELQRAVAELIEHPEQARAMGMRGRQCIDANRGALEKQLQLVKQLSGI
ncbi:3-deoxy-D-manno-octulosonic acid transferase [Amphritea balenae]|uniref:3-deoxy-D-manno-octulosonic acid transferase n=1 Tax=Amphritea balenae TaxID=452629 RepID=A0A3P1SJF2_9GAMM|nr:3-deoxy-D-manno-octulosonic acid transferase [Amphritea balenae]